MALGAQVEPLARLAAHVAHQRLQAMHQWVPNGRAGDGHATIADVHRQEQLGLDDEQSVDELQFDPQLVSRFDIGQFGAHHRDDLLLLLVAQKDDLEIEPKVVRRAKSLMPS